MVTLNSRIRKERQKIGWTQVEFANKLGLSKQTINNWENERRTPDPNTVVAIADLFGVSTDYLLGKESKVVTQEHLTNVNNRIKEDLGEDVEVMFRDITSFDDAEKEELKNFIDFIKSKKKKTP